MLLIPILSLCLACQDKEIDLLTDQAKEYPLKGKEKSVIVFGGNDKTTKEWVYDATTKQLSGSKIIDSLAKTSILVTFKRDADGKMQSIGIEKINADGSKYQSEKGFCLQ